MRVGSLPTPPGVLPHLPAHADAGEEGEEAGSKAAKLEGSTAGGEEVDSITKVSMDGMEGESRNPEGVVGESRRNRAAGESRSPEGRRREPSAH